MQAGSFGLVATVILIVALALAFGIALAAPLLAVPFFIVGFGAFLLWRGKRRSEARLGKGHGARVPSTEEAAADPVADSSVPDAARRASDTRTRHEPV